jgi:hypothetical protein
MSRSTRFGTKFIRRWSATKLKRPEVLCRGVALRRVAHLGRPSPKKTQAAVRQ